MQDGSELRFATRKRIRRLEVVGGAPAGGKSLCMYPLETLAATPQGLPLGILRCAFYKPSKRRSGASRRWIEGIRGIAKASM